MPKAYPGESLAWLREQITNRDRSECWPWPFARHNQGYGMVRFQGQFMRAPSVALILDGHKRPTAPNHWALHSCDNPPCCNPAHLRWGSARDNTNDAYERGGRRPTRGERSGNAKLTAIQVIEIRLRYSDGEKQLALAAAFGISRPHVSALVNRKTWTHIA